VGQSGTPEEWRAPEFNFTSIEALCGLFVPDLLNYDHATHQPVVALVVTAHRTFARTVLVGHVSDGRLVARLSASSQAGRPEI
jgi:hypothetical protein